MRTVLSLAWILFAVAPALGVDFQREVAPLLARRCLGCHNPTDRKGKLDLTQEATLKAGGENGAVLAPGKLAESTLWQRVQADEMPPKKPLSADEKQVLAKWIESGADWTGGKIDLLAWSSEQRAGYDWWSLQPVKKVPPPHTKSDWVKNDIDPFILAKLNEAGLSPSPQADARTLLRRLYFDLLGLPPTPEEMQKWLSELSPTAVKIDDAGYARLVDHLLASPHYGERWGRHWLDVVRFGESQGFERNKIRENAWRYRDWVVDAFNGDLPYDEFIRQQIAGDVLYPNDLSALIATGYHVCGTWDQVAHLEGSQEMRKAARQDAIEDLVAALGQSFLAMSINCARCHDHKFDPISQRDYYAVAACLGGVEQQEKERDGIKLAVPNDPHVVWQGEIEKQRTEIYTLEETLRKKYGTAGSRPIDGLVALYVFDKPDVKSIKSSVGEPLELASGGKVPWASTQPATKLVAEVKQTNELTIEAWITPAKDQQKGPARIVTLSQDTGQRNFTLGQEGNRFDVRLRTTKTDSNGNPSLASPETTVSTKRTHVVFTFERSGIWRLYVDGKQVAEKVTGGYLSNWSDGYKLALGDELTGERRWEGEHQLVAIYNKAITAQQVVKNFETHSRDVRGGEPIESVLANASADERTKFAALQSQFDQLQQREPAPAFAGVAHVIIPKQPPLFHVLDRGNHRKLKDVVSPGALAALRGDFGLAPDAPDAERRKHLAAWLSEAKNPLTARVMVNRVWHYHFGRGIVDTPSDFGFAGGRPSHPELLDTLAARFIEGGWKLKDLHRLILNSATYRQASNVTSAKGQQLDADNRLLWRANSRRLEGEVVRDAMLATSGVLNRKIGGPSYRDMKVNGGVMGTNAEFTEPTGDFNATVNRRTIYRLWARQGSNPMLESLDCPDPSVMSPKRGETITPVQALSLLNNRVMEQCAASFAQRVHKEAGDDLERQVNRAYAWSLHREPQPQELEIARKFLASGGLEQFCLVLLNCNEFLFME